jgi:predicted ATPase
VAAAVQAGVVRRRIKASAESTCDRKLPLPTKPCCSAGQLECRYGGERQRKVQPLPSPASAGRYRPGPRHLLAGTRRRSSLDAVGGPESIARSVRRGEQPVQGTRRTKPISLRLGFASDELSYAIELGLPLRTSSAFALDPEIKRECIWTGPVMRPSTMLVDRRDAVVRMRAEDESWTIVTSGLAAFDSVMTHVADPLTARETLMLRESVRGWRFYDHFRTDPAAPARAPQIATRTVALADDGADVAAAIQTIREIGEDEALAQAVDDAFPKSRLLIEGQGGRFGLTMQQHGLLRPLSAAELSDGTLRYLLWIAALLTPRPPALMVLNEPETSLHPDLLAPLARLIGKAAQRSQVIVVTHAAALIEALSAHGECQSILLEKQFGETTIAGAGQIGLPSWHWPGAS